MATQNWLIPNKFNRFQGKCHSSATALFGEGGGVLPGSFTALGEATERLYDYTGYDTTSDDSIVRRSGGHLPIRRTVYNLEVAESHSYFVGKLGLWVQGAIEVSACK